MHEQCRLIELSMLTVHVDVDFDHTTSVLHAGQDSLTVKPGRAE